MARSYSSGADSNFSEESEYESGDDYVEKVKQAGIKRKLRGTSTRRQSKAKAVPTPTYIARVTATATEGADTAEDTSKVDRADSNVLARIRKAMKLAAHPGTGEAEAKVAMRMATKLMQSQNLTQADLIANETAEERSTRAGQSTVTITSTNGKMVRNQRWYDVACSAACEAFDVQVYSESGVNSLDEVFYGLADNTVAAALAFEMLHNQIETWALERKEELNGRSAGTNYRLGVAERVLEDAEKENRIALRQAQEAEKKRLREEAAAAEAARAAEIARLATPVVAEPMTESPVKETKVSVKIEDVPDEEDRTPLADLSDVEDENELPPSYEEGAVMYDESEDIRADFNVNDEDALGHLLDLDALELKVQVKPEPVEPSLRTRRRSRAPPTLSAAVKPEPEAVTLKPPSIKSEPSDTAPSWTSALQLRTFRDNAKTIADTYLKDTGMKLYKGAKLREIKYDHAAFTKGWNDGRKVDLKRRRIEGEEIKIKKEK